MAKASFDLVVQGNGYFVTVLCAALVNKKIFTIDEIDELVENIHSYTFCEDMNKPYSFKEVLNEVVERMSKLKSAKGK